MRGTYVGLVFMVLVTLALLLFYSYSPYRKQKVFITYDDGKQLMAKCSYTFIEANNTLDAELMSQSPMTVTQAERLFSRYLNFTGIKCKEMILAGLWTNNCDPMWPVCIDEPYTLKPSCIVYSFGIDYDFSFDDIMGTSGCEVHSFDPSMTYSTYQRTANITFHNIGIGEKDDSNFRPRSDVYVNKGASWQTKTMSSLMQYLKHTDKVIDVVKMDVEGYEWEVVNNMLNEGTLSHVKQLLIEWHVYNDRRHRFVNVYETFKRLYAAGLRRFYVHRIVYMGGARCPYIYCNQVNIGYLNFKFHRTS